MEAGEDPADTNQNAEAGQDPAAADTAEDKTAAEDAVQETFLKVIRYMPNYRHRAGNR